MDLKDICSICLYNRLCLTPISKTDNGDTHYDKLITLFPEMDFEQMNDERLMCKECCDFIDAVCAFREKCLRSKQILTNYNSQLKIGAVKPADVSGEKSISHTESGKETKVVSTVRQPVSEKATSADFKQIWIKEEHDSEYENEDNMDHLSLNEMDVDIKKEEGSNDIEEDNDLTENVQENIKIEIEDHPLEDINDTEYQIEEINDEASSISGPNVIPEVSKEKYRCAYNTFIIWHNKQKTNSFSENVLLAYFVQLSTKFKASTLWTNYSMLRTTLIINNNVNISNYGKLKSFLKRKADGYRPKKSKIFTAEEINKFIKEAPDFFYLLEKVVLIMGVMGACRRNELYLMRTTDLTYSDSAVVVEVTHKQAKVCRKFTISGQFFEIFKQYADLRPQNITSNFFFCNYQKGRCTVQRVGINKFGSMGKHIATFLKLPNPELYTGHCFRRSSAEILVDSSEEVTSLKRHGMWKSIHCCSKRVY